MKRKRSNTLFALATGASLFVALPQTAFAEDDISVIVKKADLAGKENNWAEAYPLYKKAVGIYPEKTMIKLFGAKSAAYLWFQNGRGAQALGKQAAKGRDEEALKQAEALFLDAIESYKKCGAIGTTLEENVQRNRIHYQIGQCLSALGKHDEALASWETFKEGYVKQNPTESFVLDGKGKGKYILDKALALLKKPEPDLAEGIRALEFLVQPKVKVKYKITDSAIVVGFQALCQAIQTEAEKVKEDEVAKGELEKKLIVFMMNNREMLTFRPFQMYTYTPLFLKFAIEYKKLGLDKASFMMQSFLPNTTLSKEDMELRLTDLGGQKGMIDFYDKILGDDVKQNITNLNMQVDKGEPHEMTQNLIMADYYETEGNSRAAFAIYEMIELYHSDHPKRENWLLNAVRASYNLGETSKTDEYGQRFLTDFPESEHRSSVEKYMFISLFQNGKYAKCIEIVKTLLPNLQPGTGQHDIALYCLGGSYYYLGKGEQARPVLEEHVKFYGKSGEHKESEYALATQYWNGSNETYLQQWELAAQKLDQFLRDYPEPSENPYFPHAKYDRANCHTNLEEDEKSIKNLDMVITNYPDSGLLDKAHTLRGNNYQKLTNFDGAYSDYKEALAISRRVKNESVEEEVLSYLVLLLGDKLQPAKTEKEKVRKAENFKVAVKYYDEFWDKYNNGPYSAKVAVTSLTALASNGRGVEGLENLKQVILKLANVKAAPGMAEAINSYTEEYLLLNKDDAEKLKDHYVKDFKISSDKVYALSLVKMSLVDTYGRLKDTAVKAGDDSAAKKWEQAIAGGLNELKTFNLEKLNNFTLLSIGESLRQGAETTVALKQAARFYEQILKNVAAGKELTFKNESIFGLASVLVETGEDAKMAKAFEDLKGLRESKTSDRRTKEKAHYSMMKISEARGNFAQAITEAESFMKTYKNSRSRTVVRMTLANANYKEGDNDEAERHYVSVVSSAAGFFEISGPATLRVMELRKDKYKKWHFGASFIKSGGASFDKAEAQGKMDNQSKKNWQKIKDMVSDLETEQEVIDGRAEAAKRKAAEDRVRGIR